MRDGIAHKFVQECDALWVTATAIRVAANASLDRAIALYGQRFGNNVAIIVTNSDFGIDDALAEEMRKQRRSLGEYDQQREQIQEISQQIVRLKNKLPKPNASKRQRTMTQQERNDIRDQLDELESELRDVKNKQYEDLVDVRNTFVSAQLKEGKQKHLAPGAELSVFCISNTHYAALKGANIEETRQMSALSTGIPALRTHALELAAPAEFRTAENYINKVVTLYRGADLWASTAGTDGHPELMKAVNHPSQLLETCIHQYNRSVLTQSTTQLSKRLHANRNEFISAACVYFAKVCNWNKAVIRAFVTKHGKHFTPSTPYTVWNEQFTELQSLDVVDRGWALLVAEQKKVLDDTITELTATLTRMPLRLDSLPSSLPLPTQRFQAMVEVYIARIRSAWAQHDADLDKDFKNIKLDATRDVPTAYFTCIMVPQYDHCRQENGPGCTERMTDRLHTFLSNPCKDSPFIQFQKMLDSAIANAVNESIKLLHANIRNILTEMAGQFDTILRKAPSTLPEYRAKRAVLGVMEQERGTFDRIVQDLAAVRSVHGLEG